MLINAWFATVPTLRPMIILFEATLLWVTATLCVFAALPTPRALVWGTVPVIATPRLWILDVRFVMRINARCALGPALCPVIVFLVAAESFVCTAFGVQAALPVWAAIC
jgi:hypothetical protein